MNSSDDNLLADITNPNWKLFKQTETTNTLATVMTKVESYTINKQITVVPHVLPKLTHHNKL